MTRPRDVQLSIRGIVALLAAPPAARADDRPFTLIVNPKQAQLYDYLLERGLREHLGLDDGQPYDLRDIAHTDGLAVFLRRDLDGGSLYAVPKQDTVLLVGRRTVVRLRKYADRDEAPTWQTAFCLGPAQLTNSEGGSARVRLPAGRLAVRSTRAAHNDRGLALASRHGTRCCPVSSAAPTWRATSPNSTSSSAPLTRSSCSCSTRRSSPSSWSPGLTPPTTLASSESLFGAATP